MKGKLIIDVNCQNKDCNHGLKSHIVAVPEGKENRTFNYMWECPKCKSVNLESIKPKLDERLAAGGTNPMGEAPARRQGGIMWKPTGMKGTHVYK